MRISAPLIGLLAISPVLMADSLSGLWQATVNVNGLDIPFRIELQADGDKAKARCSMGKNDSPRRAASSRTDRCC